MSPRALLLALALATAAGCATTDPAMEAYDRAAAMGLASPRLERPAVRLCDSPWSRGRCLEISR